MANKILIVDDDLEIIDMLNTRLKKEGYEVATALDGEEALSKVAGFDPDVVLLDLMLPKLNGFDVLARIRQEYKDKWRPVIIISAQAELETLKRCYSLEADHYLTKPCTMGAILQGIRTMLSLIPSRIN
ncbi:MAG: response regulator [Candidatus Omnitrophica bacterium]|nr:response regulator [Candidatus Omnitrophota bacterium]